MATASNRAGARRIATLDIVRGVAVMGILAMNIVAFAMPEQAYVNPLAYGADSAADFAAWALNFVFVDGKMRGLFSFLFGASMLLVIQLAAEKGESPAKVTFSRQLSLLVFGMLHFYLIWWGDILIGYALIGMIAWLFRGKPARSLVRWGIAFLTIQFLIFGVLAALTAALAVAVAEPGADPDLVQTWNALTLKFGVPSAAAVSENLQLYRGPWTGILEHQLGDNLLMPLMFAAFAGWETLGFMLLGMAALKSGMLTGEWSDRRYRRIAFGCLAASIVIYALLAARLFADEFAMTSMMAWASAATVPVRPVMVVGYAALIILATRRGGWLVDRIAAAGRAAFSNYLGTSIVMTFVFYGWGLGLYGHVGRAELWLVVAAMWLVMLAWSKPWLDRFNYGPFEWAWRSLARWKRQPMRKLRNSGSAAAGA